MYRKIRITVVSMIALTLVMLSSGTTLSYFTDTDSVTNDFTVGNVSTVLKIYDDVTGEKRAFDTNLYSPLNADRDIPFYLQAMNNGNVSAYQRFRVVVPIALADVVTLKSGNDSNCKVAGACSNTSYTVAYNSNVNDTYAEYYIVSNAEVTAGQNTSEEWPVTKISISGVASVDASLFGCTNKNNTNCVLGISVYSDAIQANGFANAEEAFEGFGETY